MLRTLLISTCVRDSIQFDFEYLKKPQCSREQLKNPKTERK